MFSDLLNNIYVMVQSAVTALASLALETFGTDLTSLNTNLPRLGNFTSTLKVMGIVIATALFLISLITFFMSTFSGKSENPIYIFLRLIVSMTLVAYSTQLAEFALDMTTKLQNLIVIDGANTPSIQYNTIIGNTGVQSGTTAHIFLMLLLTVVFSYFFVKILLQLIERYIYLGIYIYTSPIFLSMFASKETSNIAEKWLGLFLGQNILVLLTTWAVKVVITTTSGEVTSFLGFVFTIAMMSAAAHISDLLSIFGIVIPQQKLDKTFGDVANMVKTVATPIAKEGKRAFQRAVLGSDNSILGRTPGANSTGNIVGNAVKNTKNGFDLAGNSAEVKNDTRVVKTESGSYGLRHLNTNTQESIINTSQNGTGQQQRNRDGSVSLKTDVYSPNNTATKLSAEDKSSVGDVQTSAMDYSVLNSQTNMAADITPNTGRPIEKPNLKDSDVGRATMAGFFGTSAQGNQDRNGGSIFKALENRATVNSAIQNSNAVVSQRVEQAKDINKSIDKVNDAMSKPASTVSGKDVSKALGIDKEKTGLGLNGQFMHSDKNSGYLYGMATVTDRYGNTSDRMVALSFNPDEKLPDYYNSGSYKNIGDTGVRVYTASLDTMIKNNDIKVQLETDRNDVLEENKRYEEQQRRQRNKQMIEDYR